MCFCARWRRRWWSSGCWWAGVVCAAAIHSGQRPPTAAGLLVLARSRLLFYLAGRALLRSGHPLRTCLLRRERLLAEHEGQRRFLWLPRRSHARHARPKSVSIIFRYCLFCVLIFPIPFQCNCLTRPWPHLIFLISLHTGNGQCNYPSGVLTTAH